MNDHNDYIKEIKGFYNRNPDAEEDRLDRHQLEFDMTWRYLERYLPPGKDLKVLEIGAATGIYTLGLAARGYEVTAVDLSAGLLDRCRHNLAQAGLADRVTLLEADARDLSQIAERSFDAVLLMGPLYHIFRQEERAVALQQACDHLRPGGIFFSAHISRFGIMGNLIKKSPDWIEDRAAVSSHLEYGHIPKGRDHHGFLGYFATIEEIAPLHEAVGFETMVLAGIEPGISDDDASYNQLEGEQRKLWLDLFFKMSTDPTLIGASRHYLYVGRKPDL